MGEGCYGMAINGTSLPSLLESIGLGLPGRRLSSVEKKVGINSIHRMTIKNHGHSIPFLYVFRILAS
jgi:hypothetical protein